MYPVKPDHPAILETNHRLSGMKAEAVQHRLARQLPPNQTQRNLRHRIAQLVLSVVAMSRHTKPSQPQSQPEAKPVLKHYA